MKSKYMVWVPVIGIVTAPLIMIKERATVQSIGVINMITSAIFQAACVVYSLYCIFLN